MGRGGGDISHLQLSGKHVPLKKGHMTYLSYNYFVLKVEKTANIISSSSLLISMRDSHQRWASGPSRQTHEQRNTLDLRKFRLWVFWGNTVVATALCLERKYVWLKRLSKWSSIKSQITPKRKGKEKITRETVWFHRELPDKARF